MKRGKIFICLAFLCLTILLICMSGNVLTAQAATVEDLTYTIADGEVTITDCLEDAAGELIIPATIEGYPVTGIGDAAFEDCSSLTSITIPDGVTSIGDAAFYSCRSLTSVSIGNGVTSIGGSAFTFCRSLTSVTIPNSVTSIGALAFEDCSSLTSITIPDGITHISYFVFDGCNSLQYNTYNNAKYLGNAENPYVALMECTSKDITSCNIHENTKVIAGKAFAGCDSLTSITIPDSVSSICDEAFAVCSSLTKVVFEGNAPRIDTYAFFYVAATAYYPANDDSWTEEVMKNCGAYGNFAWVTYTPLKITTQPKNGYAIINEYAKTTVKASGDGLTYQWYVKDIGDTEYSKSSQNTATYACKMSGSTTGRYAKCKITDQYGNTVWTNTVRLRIKDLAVTSQSGSKTVKEGTTVKFKVTTNGTKVTYQWQYRTSTAGSWKNASATGNKTQTLSVPATISRHGYQYRCRITDSAGNKVYTEYMTLNVLGIKTQPVSKTVVADKTAKFTVSATGKSLEYQWQYRTSSGGSWKNASATGNKTKTLSVPASVSRHGYQYRCKITDSAGNVIYTKTVNLYVLGIKTQPASKTVKVGATAKFTVTATGRGLTYQWQYKTSSIGSWKNVSATSGKTANYSLTAKSRHNGYFYRCKITDSAGNVIYSNTVKLTVK